MDATINEICELFGLTPRAVRFYEERGLVHPHRDRWNRRRFGWHDRGRLEVIALLRKASVPLAAIREVLESDPDRQALPQVVEVLRSRASMLEQEHANILGLIERLQPRIGR